MGATTGAGGRGTTGLLTATTDVWEDADKLFDERVEGVSEMFAVVGLPAVCFASLTGFPKVPKGRKKPGGGVSAVVPDLVAGRGLAPSQPSS